MQSATLKICFGLLLVVAYVCNSDAAPTEPPSVGDVHHNHVQTSGSTNAHQVMGKLNGNLQAGTAHLDEAQPEPAVSAVSDHHRVKRNKRPIRYRGKSAQRRD